MSHNFAPPPPLTDRLWSMARDLIIIAAAALSVIIAGRAAALAFPTALPVWLAIPATLSLLAGGLFAGIASPPQAPLLLKSMKPGALCYLIPALYLGCALAGSSVGAIITTLLASALAAVALASPTLVQTIRTTLSRQRRTDWHSVPQNREQPPAPLAGTVPQLSDDGTPDEGEAADPFTDPSVMQSQTRRRDGEAETLEAVLRVTFAAGQREAAVHVPVWPAFAGVPEVEAEPLDDAAAAVRITAALPYGLRLEVRRPNHADADIIAIGVRATAIRTAADEHAA